jgi:hypothetical protein
LGQGAKPLRPVQTGLRLHQISDNRRRLDRNRGARAERRRQQQRRLW